MSQRPYKSMDALRPVVFLDALLHLQGMLGRHVAVELNEYGCFFGCGFEGELLRVDPMPGDSSAICVVIDRGGGFFLDPTNCQPYVVEADGVVWLEFHRPVGPVIAIQAIDRPREEAQDVQTA